MDANVQIDNLDKKILSLITKNARTEEYFKGYEAEFKYIKEHFEKYGKVPDRATFLSKFTEFNLIDVDEPDKYLLDTLDRKSVV